MLWIFEGRRPDTEGDSTRFRPFTPEQRIRWMQEHAPRTLAWITVNHRWPELTEL